MAVSTDGETSDLTRGRVKKEHASRYSHDAGPAHHTVSRKTHKDSVETADNRGRTDDTNSGTETNSGTAPRQTVARKQT